MPLPLSTPIKYPFEVKLYAVLEVFLIIFLVSIFVLFISSETWGSSFLFLLIFVGLPVSLYKIILYNSISFILEPGKITINSGIFTRSFKVIPFDKIQNVNSVRTIPMRILSLSTINVWTSSPSQINIKPEGNSKNRPGGSLILSKEDAQWLQKFLTYIPPEK